MPRIRSLPISTAGISKSVHERIDHKITRSDIRTVLEEAMVVMANLLENGVPVKLPGVGIIQIKTSAARMARNPKTGAVISLPDRKMLKLRLAANMKSRLNS